MAEGRVVRRKIGGVAPKPRPVEQVEATRPLPRIARLMALAIYFDELIRTGQVENYAELAKIGRVSRARVTQIMDLLALAPSLQEKLLLGPTVTERSLRANLRLSHWSHQSEHGLVSLNDGAI